MNVCCARDNFVAKSNFVGQLHNVPEFMSRSSTQQISHHADLPPATTILKIFEINSNTVHLLNLVNIY